MTAEKTITAVDDNCNITHSDGSTKPCEHRPYITLCTPGYGPLRGCPKWDYHHLHGRIVP